MSRSRLLLLITLSGGVLFAQPAPDPAVEVSLLEGLPAQIPFYQEAHRGEPRVPIGGRRITDGCWLRGDARANPTTQRSTNFARAMVRSAKRLLSNSVTNAG
jgi:hypothetical protein